MSGNVSKMSKELAQRFVDFVNETGSPYHSVAACKKVLTSVAGFEELHDGKAWNLKAGGKYFVTKSGADVMAFVVGGKFSAKESGLSLIGAHTDSPCLRLRPNSKMPSSGGMLQVGIQTYGGGLWHTWFDRPLGLAGKVIVKRGSELQERLVRIPKGVMIIPNLAIHLTNAEERKAFAVNPETHLQPVMCSKMFDDEATTRIEGKKEPEDGVYARHHRALLEMVAMEANCNPGDLVDADLCLMDAQPSNIIGYYDEFISSPRIDNLVSTWAAVLGLADFASNKDNVKNARDICVAFSLDHEEVGSQSATGADGETLPAWLERLLGSMDVPPLQRAEVYDKSFLLSVDCAHAVHPNYGGKHQNEHRPEFHKGLVIKANANQRYATTPLTSAIFREVCAKASVPVQDFVVRNDAPCGSTIGPIISSKLGVRTIDIGAGQWSMHSIRETCATSDAAHLKNLCEAFFEHFREIDRSAAKL